MNREWRFGKNNVILGMVILLLLTDCKNGSISINKEKETCDSNCKLVAWLYMTQTNPSASCSFDIYLKQGETKLFSLPTDGISIRFLKIRTCAEKNWIFQVVPPKEGKVIIYYLGLNCTGAAKIDESGQFGNIVQASGAKGCFDFEVSIEGQSDTTPYEFKLY